MLILNPWDKVLAAPKINSNRESVPILELTDFDGTFHMRVFDDGDRGDDVKKCKIGIWSQKKRGQSYVLHFCL